MEPERWQRIEEVFHRAVELTGRARSDWVDRECGGDLELRASVERLLRDDATDRDLFDRVDDSHGPLPPDPNLGRELGVYRLTSRLGEGGMGLVYRGERTDGLFDQDVAVKLIRAERATEEMIRRFEFERSTLAALNHPNIARLYDGGTTEEGLPYLVMEFVPGEPVDQYCDERGFSLEERLRLFVPVCRAVHFAHQNLVIHRDLKPGNILVDHQGAPKLLDFGIARLADDDHGTSAPRLTRTLAPILTPEYASPEQLTGGAVTTAIDVYALGVVLYGLLTGKRPFQCDSRSPLEWHRMVIEDAPLRPSTAVIRTDPLASEQVTPEKLAHRCGVTPARLRRKLRGDLDRIVLMALRKEPERRFASVQELADDIERHLDGKPVLACEDSVLYRAEKFVRRNRIGVGSAAAVLLALVLGLFAARRGERLAREQALHARIEADSFHGIADFLMDTFLASSTGEDEGEAHRRSQRRRILLHADRVRRQYPDEVHLRANLLDALGHVCLELDLLDEAERLAREALELRAAEFGSESLEAALSWTCLGRIRFERGDHDGAIEHLTRALELHRTCPPGTHTDVATAANDLAAALRNAGRIGEAETLHREALHLRRSAGAATLPVAESLNNLAGIHLDRGGYGEAREGLSEALRIREAVLGPEDALTLQTRSNLAIATWRTGEHAQAIRILRDSVAGLRKLRMEAREDLELALSNLSMFHFAAGELEEAEPLLKEALDVMRGRLGPAHPKVASAQQKLAVLLHHQGRDAEADATWEQVLAIRRASPTTARVLGRTLHEYGVFLVDTADLARAEESLREAADVLEPLASEDPATFGRAQVALGQCLIRAGRNAEAASPLRVGVEHLEKAPGATSQELAAARGWLAQIAGRDRVDRP